MTSPHRPISHTIRGFTPKSKFKNTNDNALQYHFEDDRNKDLKFTPNFDHKRIEIALNVISIHEIMDTAHTFRGNMLLQVHWDASPLERPTKPLGPTEVIQAWRPWIQLHNLSEREDVFNLGQPGVRYTEGHNVLDEEVSAFYRKPENIGKPCMKFEIKNFIATFINELDLRNFPFDMQRLRVTIVSNEQRHAILTHKKMPGTSDATIKSSLEEETISAWDVEMETDSAKRALGHSARAVCHYRFAAHDPANSSEGNIYQRLDVTLVAKREPGSVLYPIILPVLFLTCSSFSAFSIDIVEQSGERLSILYTIVLTIVAQQIVTQSRLPQLSYLTWLDHCLLALQITVYLAVVETSIVESISKHLIGDPSVFLAEEDYHASLAIKMRQVDLNGFYIVLGFFIFVLLIGSWSGLRRHHNRALKIQQIKKIATQSFETEEDRVFRLYRFSENQLVEVNLNDVGPPDWRLAFVIVAPEKMKPLPGKNHRRPALLKPPPTRPLRDEKRTIRFPHVQPNELVSPECYRVRLFTGSETSYEPDYVISYDHVRNPKAHALNSFSEARTSNPQGAVTLGNYRIPYNVFVKCVVKNVARIVERPPSFTFDVEFDAKDFEKTFNLPNNSTTSYDRYLLNVLYTDIRPIGGVPPAPPSSSLSPSPPTQSFVSPAPRAKPSRIAAVVDANGDADDLDSPAVVHHQEQRQEEQQIAVVTPFDVDIQEEDDDGVKVGDLIEARYVESDEHYYLGLITSKNGTTCGVDFKGGAGVKHDVPKNWIRKPVLYAQGNTVDVWDGDNEKWVKGEIVDLGTSDDPRFLIDLLPENRREHVQPKDMKAGGASSAMALVPPRSDAPSSSSGAVSAYVLQ